MRTYVSLEYPLESTNNMAYFTPPHDVVIPRNSDVVLMFREQWLPVVRIPEDCSYYVDKEKITITKYKRICERCYNLMEMIGNAHLCKHCEIVIL